MNTQKGNSIIIISVIIALVLFLAAGSVGGYFVYKYYFAENEKDDDRDREKSKKDDDGNDDSGSSVKLKKDAEGFIDCGISINDEESFDDPFWDIDFNKDEAMVCMGRNSKNKCEKAKAMVPINEIDLIYKITGTSRADCRARFEGVDYEGKFVWIECPISNLISFVNIQASSAPIFEKLKTKMNSNNGNFAASIFTTMAMVLSEDMGTLEEFGCTGTGF